MKKIVFIIIIICFGCAVNHKAKKDCDENLKFKEVFFKHIDTVENITYGKSLEGNLRKSLEFISKYSFVSYRQIENYEFMYNSLETFEKDKAGWLKWYEENKCKNISDVSN